MSRKFRVAYFAHSLRSDWNNGNAHFLRGLLRNLIRLGHEVTIFEPSDEWSLRNLKEEAKGADSMEKFAATYPELVIRPYDPGGVAECVLWRELLTETDIVILHEWNPPELADTLLDVRDDLHYRLIFHDTHHRASSSPEQIQLFRTDRFDAVLTFGEALTSIYRNRFGMDRVWTLHEAADIDIFKPHPGTRKYADVTWIGNWGDEERSAEIKQFLIDPAKELPDNSFCVYGVRYPERTLALLHAAGMRYEGYLPNLDAPAAYGAARLTLHIPRQQYVEAMTGIPTVRVFEALACGIPLISAPWEDTERLFRNGDFLLVRNTSEMRRTIEFLLHDAEAAAEQAMRGLETILSRHTCRHRAEQLSVIFEELVA